MEMNRKEGRDRDQCSCISIGASKMPETDDAMPPSVPFAIAINCMWPCESVPVMEIITEAIHAKPTLKPSIMRSGKNVINTSFGWFETYANE